MLEVKIDKLSDVLMLDDEQFLRFMPDFMAWYKYVKEMQKVNGGVEFPSCHMIWKDDGRTGEISGVSISFMPKAAD